MLFHTTLDPAAASGRLLYHLSMIPRWRTGDDAGFELWLGGGGRGQPWCGSASLMMPFTDGDVGIHPCAVMAPQRAEAPT
jgi:hypothetical protein